MSLCCSYVLGRGVVSAAARAFCLLPGVCWPLRPNRWVAGFKEQAVRRTTSHPYLRHLASLVPFSLVVPLNGSHRQQQPPVTSPRRCDRLEQLYTVAHLVHKRMIILVENSSRSLGQISSYPCMNTIIFGVYWRAPCHFFLLYG